MQNIVRLNHIHFSVYQSIELLKVIMSYRGGKVNEDNVNAALMQAKVLSDFVTRYFEILSAEL